MGFPLNKGTIDDGLITCHWHHAQFDLKSGCTFDLWADDVPIFEVRIEGDNVWVARQPKRSADPEFYRARLRRGLEQNIGLVQAKGIAALVAGGESAASIVESVASFGARHHRIWGDGMTMLSIIARLSPFLSENTLVYGLAAASRAVAENCAGEPTRHTLHGLNGERFAEERLTRWMNHWCEVRQSDGAERTLQAALDSALDVGALRRLVFGPLQQRIYADGGHAFDFSNKAFELLETIGWRNARTVLPLIVEHLTGSQSEEERGAWRWPVDMVHLIRAAEARLMSFPQHVGDFATCPSDLYQQLLDDDPARVIDAVASTLEKGVAPAEIARQLALAAAWRMARFPETNDIDDWFAPMHTFSFCNALHRVLTRDQSEPAVVRGLFHAAGSIFIDRFLNVPRAGLPGEKSLDDLPIDAEMLRNGMLSVLDERKGWPNLARLVVRYLRLGHPEEALIDTLTYATVREDLDFHKLQVLEAGVTQARDWPFGGSERELLYTAIARHLAAHCPTRRGSSQSVEVALRLRKRQAPGA
jgi:hypothetical protein